MPKGAEGGGLPSPISAIVAIVIKLALTKCTQRYTRTQGERGREGEMIRRNAHTPREPAPD